MNKLMGFLELDAMQLPSIPWKKYTGKEYFNEEYLWTVRTAVYKGNDFHLPRVVGVNAKKAKDFANNLLIQLEDRGMVIFYPYFIANKSGTLCVGAEQVVIEAVKKDLWNLVTYSDREVTLVIKNGDIERIGNGNFLSEEEIKQLEKHVPEIRRIFREHLLEGENVLLEWSFAFSCDNNKEPKGKEYLVFYEARTI